MTERGTEAEEDLKPQEQRQEDWEKGMTEDEMVEWHH